MFSIVRGVATETFMQLRRVNFVWSRRVRIFLRLWYQVAAKVDEASFYFYRLRGDPVHHNLGSRSGAFHHLTLIYSRFGLLGFGLFCFLQKPNMGQTFPGVVRHHLRSRFTRPLINNLWESRGGGAPVSARSLYSNLW